MLKMPMMIYVSPFVPATALVSNADDLLMVDLTLSHLKSSGPRCLSVREGLVVQVYQMVQDSKCARGPSVQVIK